MTNFISSKQFSYIAGPAFIAKENRAKRLAASVNLKKNYEDSEQENA
jgi:hypothetical protein